MAREEATENMGSGSDVGKEKDIPNLVRLSSIAVALYTVVLCASHDALRPGSQIQWSGNRLGDVGNRAKLE